MRGGNDVDGNPTGAEVKVKGGNVGTNEGGSAFISGGDSSTATGDQ